jgi:hypothetical protein
MVDKVLQDLSDASLVDAIEEVFCRHPIWEPQSTVNLDFRNTATSVFMNGVMILAVIRLLNATKTDRAIVVDGLGTRPYSLFE